MYIDDFYEDSTCEYVFLTEFIVLPDNDILVGLQQLDEEAENKRFPSIEYKKLSDLALSYVEADNVSLWSDEDEDYEE